MAERNEGERFPGQDTTLVGPHPWRRRPIRWLRFPWTAGGCHHCYAPKDAHPITGWTKARPLMERLRGEPSNSIKEGTDG